MIWGRTLHPGQSYTEQLNEEVHLSLAALESRQQDGLHEKSYSQVVLVTEEAEQLLCTLVHGLIFQQCLDLRLMPEDKVTFKVQGSSAVYITGYTIKTPQTLSYSDNIEESVEFEPECEDYQAEQDTEEADETVTEQEDIVIKAEMEDFIFYEDVTGDDINAEKSEGQNCDTGTTVSQEREDLIAPGRGGMSGDPQPAESVVIAISDAHDGGNDPASQVQPSTIIPYSCINSAMESPNVDGRQKLAETHHGLPSMNSATNQGTHFEVRPASPPADDRPLLSLPQRIQQESSQVIPTSDTSLGHSRLQQSYRRDGLGLPGSGPDGSRQNGDSVEGNGAFWDQVDRNAVQGSVTCPQRPPHRYDAKQSSSSSSHYQEVLSGQDTHLQRSRNFHSGMGMTPSESALTALPKFLSSSPVQSGPSRGIGRRVPPVKNANSGFGTKKWPLALPTSQVLCDRRKTKSFLCRYCNKDCHRAGALLLHERTHTGIKPFKCIYCSKEFADRSNKIKHERIHTGVKPFKCEQCGNAYSDPSAKRRHQESCVRKTAVFKNKGSDWL